MDKFQSLKASIQLRGLQHHIIETKDGFVIDGRDCKRACQELGLPYKTKIVVCDRKTAERLRLELNHCRKGSSLKGREEDAKVWLKLNPEQSDVTIADLSGLSDKTVRKMRRQLEASSEIPNLQQHLGKNGKLQAATHISNKPKPLPSVMARTEREAAKVKAQLQELGPAAPARDMLPHNLSREVRKARLERTPPQPPLKHSDIQIVESDFRTLTLDPESADLFFFDPPYTEVGLYGEAAKVCARVLKDGHFMICYTANNFLIPVALQIDKVAPALHYDHTFILVNDNCSQPEVQKGYVHGWMALLVYYKGKHPHCYRQGHTDKTKRQYIRDFIMDKESVEFCPTCGQPHNTTITKRKQKEKELFEWQQPVPEAMEVIGNFTKPGDLIVDLFGGSFTTAEAVWRLKDRRFIGCDNNPSRVACGRKRLHALMNAVA